MIANAYMSTNPPFVSDSEMLFCDSGAPAPVCPTSPVRCGSFRIGAGGFKTGLVLPGLVLD